MALLFNIQSIDTMKDSRDMAKSGPLMPGYSQIVDRQMEIISGAGANYVAIDVPYDEQFIPTMRLWVHAARAHNLHIWFRGNLSGWEGWFGYRKIGREEHLKSVENLILSHPELFEDGDIFTACPECENGGPGDPRMNGDPDSYREFLINEYNVHSSDFSSIGRNVKLISSMNADVARLIMDKSTTAKMGGVVVIDDYRKNIDDLEKDIIEIHNMSLGQIILGEFGAPIPDLNGNLNDRDQSEFIHRLLAMLYKHRDIVEGVNYWTLRFGSTALIRDDMTRKPVIETVGNFYQPEIITGMLKSDLGFPISKRDFSLSLKHDSNGVSIASVVTTNIDGSYSIPVPVGYSNPELRDIKERYATTTVNGGNLTLVEINPSLFHKFLMFTLGKY